MKSFLLRRLRKSGIIVGSLAVLALSSAPAALAQSPSFAGPSVIKLGAKATITGSNFTPSSIVRVRTEASGEPARNANIRVAADGSLSFEIHPSSTGQLKLTVLTESNQPLARTAITVMH